MAEEYMSFEDAQNELHMEEAELKALVSQGRIRAFRDANTLKFRRTDIDSLREDSVNDSTVIIPGGDPAIDDVQPLAEEPVDLFADELDYDDTAETIIGDVGAFETGDTALDLVDLDQNDPGTKVPTIELAPAPDELRPDETAVPTLELGDEVGGLGSDTEVPTMVLGLDEYDDTQIATEDVATEEVYIEEADLAEATADIEQPSMGIGEDDTAARAIGSLTASSSYGTRTQVAVREQPSPMFTAFAALTTIILMIPGGAFFYFIATNKVPNWEFLNSIFKFWYEQFNIPIG